MSRSASVALQYFLNEKKIFATNQYAIAALSEQGLEVKLRCNKGPVFFDLLQENIDSPGLLTDLQRDNVIDYLELL